MIQDLLVNIANIVFQFYFQIWLFGILTTFSLTRRKKYWLRFIGLNVLYLVVFTIAFYNGFFDLTAMHIGWFSFNYLISFIALLSVLFTCYKVKISHIVYYGMAAYCMQHFVYNVDMLFLTLFCPIFGDDTYFNILFIHEFILAACCIGFYFVFIRRIKKHQISGLDDKTIMAVAGVVMAIVYVLSCYSLFAQNQSTISSEIYGGCCSLLLLFILFSLYRTSERKIEREKIEHLLNLEREQHRLAQENMEYINMKCHDIKHWLETIKAIETRNKSSDEYFEKMEEAVKIYDFDLKTGNDALDICLTEKSIFYGKYSIIYSCMADGKALSFMAPHDIYSLIGNALDNAIDALLKVEDEAKRILDVVIKRQGKLLSIHIANYYEGNMEFKEGLPVTQQENKNEHGYGLKSIEYIVKKYGGSLSVVAKNNFFNLNIFIPISK